jgi:RNA polymerase sigma factor (sigma-70 family)
MAANSIVEIVRYLGRIERVRDAENQTDRQLLDRFLRNKDDVALETLVRRYAPMVWGVCRRTVFNHHDAEDAFQATFYVFVRKAASLRKRKSVAGWLHVAAHKTAQKARQMTRRRFERERQVTVMPEPEARTAEQTNGSELKDLLDDALSHLPERYRSVVVLCDLQEKTRPQAARQLGLPEGTVGSRLARGRALLAKRLARRGLAVSGAAVAALLSKQTVSAAVPGPLLSSTIRVAGLLALGEGAGAVSAQVSTLVKGVLKAMVIAKQRTAILVLLLAGVVPSGGLLAHHAWSNSFAPSGDTSNSAKAFDPSQQEDPDANRNDERHWPLPEPEGPVQVGETRSFKSPTATGAVTAVAFSHDGRRAITCADDGFVRQYDLAGGKELWAFNTHTPGPGTVRDVAVSRDGRLALVAVGDCTVRLLNTETGEEIRQFVGHRSRVEGVSFSNSGRLALSASGTWYPNVEHDNTVRLWDVATGTQIRCFEGHTSWVSIPVFSPDERYVLSPSDDRTIRMWDVETGEEVRRFVGHAGFIRTAVFSRDGRWILSSSEDSTLRLWDAATGAEIRRFGGHRGIVEAAVLSPDGRRALSAGKDGTLRLWDVATAKQLICLKGHNGPVNAVALFPDGKHALTGGMDGTMRLWRLPDPEAMAASLNGDGTVTKANAAEDKTAQEQWKEDSAAAAR